MDEALRCTLWNISGSSDRAPLRIVSFIAALGRIKPAHEADLDEPSSELSLGIDNRQTVGFAHRQWLLAEDRLACTWIAGITYPACVPPHDVTTTASTSFAAMSSSPAA